MILQKPLIFLTLSAYLINYSFAELSCHIHNRLPADVNEESSIGEGTLRVKYQRNNLAVYKYDNITYVNVLIDDVVVSYTGFFYSKQNKSRLDTIKITPARLEGIAVLKDYNKLGNCDLHLKRNFKYVQNLSPITQDRLFYETKFCIDTQVCEQLGEVKQDDYTRAKLVSHDFGDHSVMYNELRKEFPNMYPRDKNYTNIEKADKEELQTALNIIFEFLMSSLVAKISGSNLGTLEIPDSSLVLPGLPIIKGGFLNITKITFSDLRKISRTEDVHIMNDGIHFTISCGIEIPKARIRFFDFAKYLFVSQNGQVAIDINRILMKLKISINFNDYPCKTSLDYMYSDVKDVKFKLVTGLFFIDPVIEKIVNIALHQFIENIAKYVNLKLNNLLSQQLEIFDCERYRPIKV